ncbi:MAG: hypothetical protein CM15mP125_3800 [Gammaproteobacteria bacterium]|nr:MAG: hypothetical protein CM15mP125_3800 [Gammaproteobacteria bacterium]
MAVLGALGAVDCRVFFRGHARTIDRGLGPMCWSKAAIMLSSRSPATNRLTGTRWRVGLDFVDGHSTSGLIERLNDQVNPRRAKFSVRVHSPLSGIEYRRGPIRPQSAGTAEAVLFCRLVIGSSLPSMMTWSAALLTSRGRHSRSPHQRVIPARSFWVCRQRSLQAGSSWPL